LCRFEGNVGKYNKIEMADGKKISSLSIDENELIQLVAKGGKKPFESNGSFFNDLL